MKISRYSRRFHDPWGSKQGNRCGTIIKFQFQAGKIMLEKEEGSVHDGYHIDTVSVLESTHKKFVRTGKNSSEKLRR
jgi:hypothetical protein